MDTSAVTEKGNTGPESDDRHKRRHKSGEKEVGQDLVLQFTFLKHPVTFSKYRAFKPMMKRTQRFKL